MKSIKKEFKLHRVHIAIHVLRFLCYILTFLGYISPFLMFAIIHPIGVFFCFHTSKNSFKYIWKLYVLIAVDLALPFFGHIATCIGFIGYKFFESEAAEDEYNLYDIRNEDYIKELFDDDVYSQKYKPKEINQRHELFNLLKIEPYADILTYGSINLQLDCIEKLSRTKTKDSVQLLTQALTSDFYEIQYFAKNSLEKIDQDFLSEIESISQAIESTPNNYENYNARAVVYLDYINVGLLEKGTEKIILEKALYDTIFSLQIYPKQVHLNVRILEIYYKLERYEDILNLIPSILETTEDEEDTLKIKFYEASTYYHLQQFDKTNSIIEYLSKQNSKYTKISQQIDWWLNQEVIKDVA